MRFSIRELLALTFLAVLAMLAWRTSQEARRDEERLMMRKNELQDLELKVRLGQSPRHQALLRTRDEFKALHAMRERSVEHFERLRQKYSSIERPEAGELAIRTIPSLQTGTEPAPVTFRLWVPEERSVWLSFGVHPAHRSVQSSRESEKADDLLSDSPFDDSGPFERQLPAGDQTLKIATESAQDGAVPLTITLDDEVLLHSAFVSPDATSASPTYISGRSQIDFGPTQRLPWLLTARMNIDASTAEEESDMTHAFSLWLSDQSSRFTNFPGK